MKRIKENMCILLIAAMLPCSAVNSEETGFSDTTEHWAKETVETYAGNGYINGYPDGTFKPDEGVSVAEFCRIAENKKTVGEAL